MADRAYAPCLECGGDLGDDGNYRERLCAACYWHEVDGDDDESEGK